MYSIPFLTLGIASSAFAGRRDSADDQLRDTIEKANERGLATSAGEIPALAQLLEKAGWDPTPELSGVFQAGAIFEQSDDRHALLASKCIAAPPVESTYTAAEIVTSLQAGVSVRAGIANMSASGGIVKKVKFGAPVQFSVPALDLILTDECRERIEALPRERLDRAYVVREALLAEIAEQTCGRVDASGRIVGLGSADAELAAACAQASLEPVAVGYRKVPLTELLPVEVAAPITGAPLVETAPVEAPPPAGPFALVLTQRNDLCEWTVEDAPSGRSATVFATRTCPDEIAWSGTTDLYFNDGDQVYTLNRSSELLTTKASHRRPTGAR